MFILFSATGFAAPADELKQETVVKKPGEYFSSLNDERLKARFSDCTKAFGHHSFCRCINEKVAPDFSFADYIFVVTKSKAAVGYEYLPEENQQMIDSALLARDDCIKQTVN